MGKSKLAIYRNQDGTTFIGDPKTPELDVEKAYPRTLAAYLRVPTLLSETGPELYTPALGKSRVKPRNYSNEQLDKKYHILRA